MLTIQLHLELTLGKEVCIYSPYKHPWHTHRKLYLQIDSFANSNTLIYTSNISCSIAVTIADTLGNAKQWIRVHSHNTHYITPAITVSISVLGPSRLLSNRYWTLVSLVWMYELHLQLPCVLASWNNTICELHSHHPIHDLTSVSHKSHNTVSGSVTFNVIRNWRTATGNDLSNCYVSDMKMLLQWTKGTTLQREDLINSKYSVYWKGRKYIYSMVPNTCSEEIAWENTCKWESNLTMSCRTCRIRSE
jgi:hypothetical protein